MSRFIAIALLALAATLAEARPPNVVIILCDNLGNGDIACFYPQTKHRTPALDRMAAEGRRFTSFYSASGVCTPSRAALMTGCYPRRVGLEESYEHQVVLKPVDKKGLNPEEQTLAELLQQTGYATACFGKWHLGDQPAFLPTAQGFDTYLGIPYSEDMGQREVLGRVWPPLPLVQQDRVIEAPVPAERLTKQLTEAAVRFIGEHKTKPFFLYFPETGPGSRNECFPGEAFKGKSANGLYGDAIEELDWSAGEILKAIKDNGLDNDTLVIWTNDNGAVKRNPPQGSNAPYRGSGYSTSEGAMRMPCIARWPDHVPAGTVCEELCTMMDLLPTVAALTGAAQPVKAIDGHDIRPLLLGEATATSPYAATGFFYYQKEQLQAVRAGDWKLYLELGKKSAMGKGNGGGQALALYDVQHDVGEGHEVSAAHPDVVERLLALADNARRELGDNSKPGSGQRASGWVEQPRPLVKP